MSYDGIVTRKIVNELKYLLLGGKIQKITQPSKNDIVFNVYSMGKSYKLLLSANNNEARINITDRKFENPDVPPNFTMVLRKHINQAKIMDINQKGLDRVVVFSIASIDEMGFDISKKLIVEIMGKHSNIILTDENYRIIDSIKRVDESMSSIRLVQPGLTFEFLDDDKNDITEDGFSYDIKKLDQRLPDNAKPYKIFHQNYTGFSPAVGKELIYRAGIDPSITWGLVSESEKELLNKEFHLLSSKIIEGDLSSYIYKDENKIYDYHTISLSHLAYNENSLELMSKSIEKFYEINKTHDRLNQMKNNLSKKVDSSIKSTQKKISILNDNILNEAKIEKLRYKGDLLSANVHKIKRGDQEIIVNDFYQRDKEVKISLDPMKSPWENAENYYNRAKKINNSISFAKKDLPKQNNHLSYLIQLKDFIQRSSSIEDLEEIREEMVANHLIKKTNKKKSKLRKSKPMHFLTDNNSDIYVGKNSKQNDYITLKLANKNDLWFHVKDLAGSHVILRSDDINQDDIEIAAYLAAVHSSIGSDKKVDVDYTQKKNVNKPKGAALGMVYYDDFQTITVDTSIDIKNKYEEK